MDKDWTKLDRRYQEARQYKYRWLALYKELYFYVLPNRDAFNEIFGYIDTGKPVTQQIWDTTAMVAAYERANDLHGLLMPKDRRWGKFELDPHLYNADLIKSAQPTVDDINERIFWFLNQSNISRVVGSSNLDLVGGTGAIWIESKSERCPLYFRSIPAVSLFIEYSTDDTIVTCWFTQKMTSRDILENYPDYKGSLRSAMIESPDEQRNVIYGQIKYTEYTVDKFYIYAVLDNDPEWLLFERDSNYQQIIVYRDRVRPGEAEGRGIGIDMLPTIRDLNLISMYSRKNMAFKANPPMFYDAGSYFNPNSIRQWAGAMIARNPQGRNPLEALQMPTYPDVFETEKDLREQIRNAFQVDPLGEVNTPVRSATEVSIRENRAQRTSSTDISRLINELPKPIFETVAIILNNWGLLVSSRQQIPKFNTANFKFSFSSPLFDLQKQDDLNHLVTNLQIKQQFMGEGVAFASLNLAEVNDFLTDKLNLPAKLFINDAQIAQFLQQMQQQQQQQQAPQNVAPTPTTAASPVQIPQQQGIQV